MAPLDTPPFCTTVPSEASNPAERKKEPAMTSTNALIQPGDDATLAAECSKESNAWWRQINDERDRQRAKGYDLAHDRKIGVVGLISIANGYARRGEDIKAMAIMQAAADVSCAEQIERMRPERDEPTDAEVEAAAEALRERGPANTPWWDDWVWECFARAALVAARKVAQR